MSRIASLSFGIVSYSLFLASFLCWACCRWRRRRGRCANARMRRRRAQRLLVCALLMPLGGCLVDRLPGEWDPPYRCQGNEPFWSLTIRDAEADYDALNDAGRKRVFSGGPRFQARAEGTLLHWAGVERSSGVELRAALHRETCLDSMSDETPPFAYRSELQLGPERLSGCCRRGD